MRDLVAPGSVTELDANNLRDGERPVTPDALTLEKARQYRQEILNERRVAFYQHVRARTENWLRTRTATQAR